MGFATQNGPNAPQSATFPLFQPVLSPFSPPHYCLRITTDQTLCTGSIPATSCPQCTPRNCSAPQIAPQIWMFLPLGAVGGPFALPNYYLRMSTDQTLCVSFTPATSCPLYTPHNFVAPQIAPQICILLTYLDQIIRVISVTTTYFLVLFVFPCLLHRRVAWNSTSRC